MKKLGKQEAYDYIKDVLPKEILERYKSLHILSEADLQSHVWKFLSEFFKGRTSKYGRTFKVLNKPYFQELKLHPDLVVFRGNEPWIVIELKEWTRIKKRSAVKDLRRLIKLKKHFEKLKRGYLIYVLRKVDMKVFSGPKGKGAYFFKEIPIILESFPADEFEIWEKEFKKWAKYQKD